MAAWTFTGQAGGCRLLAAIAACVATSTGFAGDGTKLQPVPGVRELTGRIIVRPLQPERLASLPPAVAAEQDIQARLALVPYSSIYVPEMDEYFIQVPPGLSEDTLADQLLRTGSYEWVIPDWLLFPTAVSRVVPNDPNFSNQWYLDKIQAPEAWRISTGSPLITVAIVDTGADYTHPDLAPNIVLGYCSVAGIRHAQTTTPPWLTIVADVNGHGTGITGVIGASGNNTFGMSGVGWNLKLMPIRAAATANGASSFGDLQDGALWATSHGARVVSISYTGIEVPEYDALGRVVRSRNALLFWTVDDRGLDIDAIPRDPPTSPPPNHPNITVVSGTDVDDQRWVSTNFPQNSSSYGTVVDIAAPASSIFMPAIGGGFTWGEGVSFAGPQAAATAALVWSVAPSLSPADVESVILASADDIGTPGEDEFFGAGRLNVRRALWNAIVRQHAIAAPPGAYDPTAFSIDDLYAFMDQPMDVTGDRVVDAKDTAAVQAFMRRDEVKDMLGDRP